MWEMNEGEDAQRRQREEASYGADVGEGHQQQHNAGCNEGGGDAQLIGWMEEDAGGGGGGGGQTKAGEVGVRGALLEW
eukprot:CAMPEP_0196666898 /NCGR_PEP_ID=MMETSP1086-20130531/64778_1 /TAXON_ID=77921 /ORGANISM="Cyanoptyche  gloeocystis , Strain SAG4.97" /LENGTH=77 /DNA_ID=CAMNT_0042004159 /DNA_START=158 /DNA_END=388 /DNA_ORIENTATION=-